MGFDSFIGNRKIVDRLVRKLHEGRFPHGVIFSGAEGLGKHTLALMIAKALNCTDVGEPAIAQSERPPAERKRDSAKPQEEALYRSGLAAQSASPTGRSIDRSPDAEKKSP